MNQNASPYAPPQADVVERSTNLSGFEQARRGRRFLNFVIDFAGYMIFGIIITVAIGFYNESYLDSPALEIWVGYPVYLLYYFLCESLTGSSLGKLITRTRVVDAEDHKPTMGKIFLRTLARVIPFESFSFFRECGQGWHDTLTDTHVVLVRKRQEPTPS
ncbi:MAG: RDD family protein [Gammaproteobacteria bacterium]